jgi:tetratricopeptide (TPR) repeat protein
MRRFLTILILLTSLIACDFKSAEEYFADAAKLSEQEKYKEAIALLDKAIEKDNKFVGAYINRGADKSSLGDYKAAIEDYNKVLLIDPKNTLALYNIGNNYKRLKDYITAIEFYNKAFDTKGGQKIYLDLTPNDFVDQSENDVPGYQIHYERAIAYYRIDSLENAYADFKVSLNKNYMTADCFYWIGLIYISRGQKDKACENFNKSKELGDKDAEIEIDKYCKE